jgi:hypothetical protein
MNTTMKFVLGILTALAMLLSCLRYRARRPSGAIFVLLFVKLK